MTLLLLFAVACGTSEPVTPPAPPPPAAPPVLSEAELRATVARVLAPSPIETRSTLDRVGIGADVPSFVPKRTFDMAGANVDVVAIRTGVVLADTVLALDTLSDAELEAQMKAAHAGLQRMGAGAGLLGTLQGMIDRHANKGVTRTELLQALDDTIGASVPESGVGPEDRTGPLLQSGAWLATTNVAAQAVLKTGKLEAAPQIFRQKAVADWFLGYVRGAAKAKADEQVLQVLEATLATLAELSGKEALTEADVKTVQEKTASLLGML